MKKNKSYAELDNFEKVKTELDSHKKILTRSMRLVTRKNLENFKGQTTE